MEMDTNGIEDSEAKPAAADPSPIKDGELSSPSIGSGGDGVAVNGGSQGETEEDTWEWFNILRTMCDTPKRIGVCLEISTDLYSESR